MVHHQLLFFWARPPQPSELQVAWCIKGPAAGVRPLRGSVPCPRQATKPSTSFARAYHRLPAWLHGRSGPPHKIWSRIFSTGQWEKLPPLP